MPYQRPVTTRRAAAPDRAELLRPPHARSPYRRGGRPTAQDPQEAPGRGVCSTIGRGPRRAHSGSGADPTVGAGRSLAARQPPAPRWPRPGCAAHHAHPGSSAGRGADPTDPERMGSYEVHARRDLAAEPQAARAGQEGMGEGVQPCEISPGRTGWFHSVRFWASPARPAIRPPPAPPRSRQGPCCSDPRRGDVRHRGAHQWAIRSGRALPVP
jgi:hypothetical protein